MVKRWKFFLENIKSGTRVCPVYKGKVLSIARRKRLRDWPRDKYAQTQWPIEVNDNAIC